MKLLLSLVLFMAFTLHFSTSSFGIVDVYSITPINPPLTMCAPVSVTVTGENNDMYPLGGINMNLNGNTITIDIQYIGGIVLNQNTPFSHIVDIGILPAGTYTVIANGRLDGIVQSSITTDIVVGTTGTIANFSYPTGICLGDEIQLINSSSETLSQKWYENGVEVSTSVDHSLTPTSAGSIVIKLHVFNGLCQHLMQVTITIDELPLLDNINASDSLLCFGDPLELTSSSSNATSFEWFENGISVADTNDISLIPSTVGTNNYQLVIANGGCLDSIATEFEVEVLALPILDLGADTSDCFGPIILDAGAGMSSYLWQDQSSGQSLIPSNTGVYSVIVTDANGCTNSDQISFQSCANISEMEEMNVQLYPNPVNSSARFEIDGFEGEIGIVISDVNGKIVVNNSQFTTGIVDLDVSALNSGIYYASLTSENGRSVVKIIKE